MGLWLEAKVRAFPRETEPVYRTMSSSHPLKPDPQNTTRNTSSGKTSFLLCHYCPSFVHQRSPFSGVVKPMLSFFLWFRECEHPFSHLGGQCLPPPHHVEGDKGPFQLFWLQMLQCGGEHSSCMVLGRAEAVQENTSVPGWLGFL